MNSTLDGMEVELTQRRVHRRLFIGGQWLGQEPVPAGLAEQV